jgi:hypothetical protein
MASSYTPVQYVFREVIDEEIEKQSEGKIFFFDEHDVVDAVEARLLKLEEVPGLGIFLHVLPEKKIRIDRLITIFGKPGAAFDEYEAYANQCLSCTGGYDL